MSETPAQSGYADKYLAVPDGLRLHYRDYPGSSDRPPLLCLHGLTRNARDFARLAEQLSPRFRVIALDFRGRGMSEFDPLPARYNPLTYAADVQELLDRLGIAQAIFIGTSLGGLVTMSIAVLARERLAGAILNDVGPELGQAGLERIQHYVGRGEGFDSWEEAGDAIALQQSAAFPAYGRRDWLAMARRNCVERDGSIVFDYDPRIADAFKTAGGQPKIDLWPLFRALAQTPLLVVRGARSQLLTASTFEAMQQAAPGAAFVTVPGVGHAPMLDEPDAVVAIQAFLDQIAP
ncbi:MAG TPA: alpha/beta hydrolase [Sphingomicrobium sp.]|nr:alpha/beta hydrolase [Sphingomicrobium sp.]